jgi:phosphatidylinositol-bisphosphatase
MDQKDYIFIRPVKGSLGPSEQISIEMTILVGNITIPHVAIGKPLEEILVLEIRNGKHIFLSLQGEFKRTCFGLPLALLASFGGKGVRNIDPQAIKEIGGGMPDELWRMTDFIINHGHTCGTLFLERGDEHICREIREYLDTARDFQGRIIAEREMGVLSMAETLLRYLDALPESVIPAELYEKALRIGELKTSTIQVLALKMRANCS